MADLIFIAIALAFIGLSAAYVRGLDRLVRSAEEPEAAQDPPRVAA